MASPSQFFRQSSGFSSLERSSAKAVIAVFERDLFLEFSFLSQVIKYKLMIAEGKIDFGEQLIASQRELVASLERSGRDSALAKDLLYMFIELQLMHIADRDRLRSALAARQGLVEQNT